MPVAAQSKIPPELSSVELRFTNSTKPKEFLRSKKSTDRIYKLEDDCPLSLVISKRLFVSTTVPLFSDFTHLASKELSLKSSVKVSSKSYAIEGLALALGDILRLGDIEGETLGLTERLILNEGETLGDTLGEGETDGLTLGLTERDSLTNTLGDGDTDGETDGLTEGEILGETLGDGETDGLTLGLMDGLTDGLTLGLTDLLTLALGEIDGLIEGLTDGLIEGDTLGLTDGETLAEKLTDGLTLGETDGETLADGDTEGLTDGETLGLTEGDADGEALGLGLILKLTDGLGLTEAEGLTDALPVAPAPAVIDKGGTSPPMNASKSPVMTNANTGASSLPIQVSPKPSATYPSGNCPLPLAIAKISCIAICSRSSGRISNISSGME